jgi:iron complex outermembrane recepter protein
VIKFKFSENNMIAMGSWRLNTLRVALAVTLAAELFICAPRRAAAQEAQLTEIVITATKRESTVQTTPISVTAVSGDEMLERGVSDLASLMQSIPAVSMRTGGPGQTEFEMRGMASTGGNSPTVGFYLDDTPLTAPAATNNGKVVVDPSLYDLNRIEVLRGPQGTLYGSGSMGGTIKLVPNPPNLTNFETSAEGIFGDTDGGGFDHRENAMLNLPLVNDTLALRIVGTQSHDSGWIDRVVIANGDFPLETGGDKVRGNVLAAPVAADYSDVNDTDLTAVRVSLLWKPTDNLSITPSAFYQRIQQDGLSEIDSNPGTNAHYEPFDSPEPFSDRFDLVSLNIQYAFNGFDLTSTTSRWTREEELRQDGSEEYQWVFGLPSYYISQGGIGAAYPTPLEDDTSRQTSEEIRLTSSSASAFQWLVGYFYEDNESNQNDFYLVPGAAPLFGTGNLYSQYQPTKIIEQAAFGEASYQLTPKLKATAGLRRYSYDESVITYSSGAVSATGTDAFSAFSAGERDQGINPKFDLSYQADENLLLYATASKGFRPGGGTGPVATSGPLGAACEANLQADAGTTAFVPSPVSYGPDHVWNYELGEKLKAFAGRLTLNGAAYFESWYGVQQNIPLPCGYNYQANAGNAHIYGGELELNALLVQGLVLSANSAYTHARVVSSALLDAGITPGTPVQDVPEWTASAALTYRRPFTDKLGFTGRIENDYVGSRTDATYTINNLPSYDLTQIRAGIEGGQWSVVLFAKNLFNERAFLSDANQININVPMYTRIVVNQPRTVGIDLNYRFGK